MNTNKLMPVHLHREGLAILFSMFFVNIALATIEVSNVTLATIGQCNGTIEVTAEGSAGPFTIILEGNNQAQFAEDINGMHTFSNLCVGTYTITVTNAYACVTPLSAIVGTCDPLELNAHPTPSCPAPSNSGTITLTVSGGAPPYTYLWSNDATSPALQGVAAGTYQVTVTDDNGCTVDGEFIVEELEAPMLSGQTAPTCDEEASGNIQLTVSGGAPPYTYLWNTGANTQNLENLLAAVYQVTVTDVNGCMAVGVFAIGSLLVPELEATTHNASCISALDGSIALTATGGTGLFTYSWSKEGDPDFEATTANISNLEIGTYCVVVSDANGCEVEGCWEVGVNDEWPYVKQVDVFVQGASQDFPIYSARWEETAAGCIQYIKNEEVFIGTEALGEITNGSNLIINVITSVDMSVFNMSLPGTSIGVFSDPNSGGTNWSFVTLNASEIVIDNAISQQLAFAGEDQSNPPKELLSLGNELEGCVELPTLLEDCSWNPEAITGTDLAHILEMPCPLDVTIVPQNQQTALEVQISGETPPYADYSFTWTSPEQPDFSATGYLIEDLPGGEYCVTIETPSGCTIEKCKALCNNLEDFTINTTASCADLNNGSACITLNNGYALENVQIDWNFENGLNFENTACVQDLPVGIYNVTLNLKYFGCDMVTSTVSITVPSNTGTFSVEIAHVAQDCPATPDGEGEVCLNINGGIEPYSFVWSTGGENVECLQEAIADASPAYSVTVTDFCGTEVILNNILPEEIQGLSFDNQIVENAYCSSETGIFSANLSGGHAPYTYLINDESNNIVEVGSTSDHLEVADLSSGNYFITITDNNCAENLVTTFQIGEIFGPPSFAIIDEEIDHVCSNGTFGSINITIGGESESGPFTFNWSNGDNTSNPTNLEAGIYTLTITNQFECEIVETYEVVRSILEPYINVKIIPSCDDGGTDQSTGEIQLTFNDVSNPAPPYHFSWGDGTQWTSNSSSYVNTIEGLTHSYHYLTITNSWGCNYETYFLVEQRTSYFLIIDYSGPANQGESTGFIEIDVIGFNASPPFQAFLYDENANLVATDITDGLANIFFNNLSEGNYTIKVIDYEGCLYTRQKSLTICQSADPITVDHMLNDITHIYGGQPGSIKINVSGGVQPYTFRWEGPNGYVSTEEDIQNLTEAGLYCIVVHDINGCRAEHCVEILDNCPQMRLLLKHANNCRTNNQGVSGLFFEGIEIIGGSTEEVFLEWSSGSDSNIDETALVLVSPSPENSSQFLIEQVIDPPTDFILPSEHNRIEVTAYLENGCSIEGFAQFGLNRYLLTTNGLTLQEFNDRYPLYPFLGNFSFPLIDEITIHRTCGCFSDGVNLVCNENHSFQERFWFDPFDSEEFNPNATNICQLGGILHMGNTDNLLRDWFRIPPNDVAIFVQDGNNCGCIFPPELVYEFHEVYTQLPDNMWEGPMLVEDYFYADICALNNDQDPFNNIDLSFYINISNTNEYNPQEGEPECPEECEEGCWIQIVDEFTCEYEVVCLDGGSVEVGTIIRTKKCRCIDNFTGNCEVITYCPEDPCGLIDISPCPPNSSDIPSCAFLNLSCICPPIPSSLSENSENSSTLELGLSPGGNSESLQTFIAPNPFANFLDLTILLKNEGNISISIFNVPGKSVLSNQVSLGSGENKIRMNFEEEFSNGLYYLYIQDDQGNFNMHKIIRMK